VPLSPPMLLLLSLIGCDDAAWCTRFNFACSPPADPAHPEVVDVDGDVWSPPWDCDDNDATVYPTAPDLCDGVDNNCDGVVDEGTPGLQTWYQDQDTDGYGVGSNTIISCDAPPGYTLESGDCNDVDRRVNPGSVEVCGNHVDDNCDGEAVGCGLDRTFDLSDAWARIDQDAPGDAFGSAIAARTDQAGLLHQDLVVGDPGRAGAGAVWLLTGTSLAASTGERLVSTGYEHIFTPQVGAELGAAVAALPPDASSPFPAVVAGAPSYSGVAEGEGVVVVLQRSLVSVPTLDLVDARLTGAAPGMELGRALLGLDDVDGDGLADLLVGAPGDQGGGGSVALFLGPLSGDKELGDADTRLLGRSGQGTLGTVLAGGDLDGDGLSDLVLPSPTEGAGQVRLLFGPTSPGELDLSEVQERISGEVEGDALGTAALVAPDIDGDGVPDLVLGAPGANGSAGAVYLMVGRSRVNARAGLVQATDALARLDGVEAGDRAGSSLTAGRFASAGTQCLAVGLPGVLDSLGLQEAGAVAIIASDQAGIVSLSEVQGRLSGTSGSGVGTVLSTLEDFDGNGLDELIVGAPDLAVSQVWIFTPRTL